MLTTKQTIFDFERGDCWRTCIACTLELPLEDVPNFCAKDTDTYDCEGRREDWYRRTVLWLRSRGYQLITFNWPLPDGCGLVPPEGLALLTGPSPRDKEKNHVVLARIATEFVKSDDGFGHTYKMYFVHDPHPDDTFIAGEPMEVSIIVKTCL